MLSSRVWEAWIPPDRVRAIDWIPAHIIIPAETETPGLFDLDLFPHVRGVLELVDDPMIRQIYLPWGVRLAKTTTALSCLIFFAVNAPRPALLGSSTEDRADDTIQTQLYPMLEACGATRDQLKPEHQRNKKFVALERCRIRKSFSGSPSTTAGFPACYGHAGEVSKWSQRKSTEADPVKLFSKRALLYPFESKFIFESSPGELGKCRITALQDDPGTDRRHRVVPCPHCGEYQELRMGTGETGKGGIRWEKGPRGKSERAIAVETAWYECEKCGGRIEDRHRPAMMRAGVWLSEGQSIDRKGRITGQPRVVSPNVCLGPLGEFYSLVISGWGQIVGEFLDSRAKSEDRRDFCNSIEGRVYDPKPVTVQAHELTERLGVPEPRGMCPAWSAFLTLAIDVQEGGTVFEWQVDAWGPFARGHLVDYGVAYGEADLEKFIREAQYPHADGGRGLRPSRGLIDAGDGHVTEQIYALCRRIPGLFPCKGSSSSAFPEFGRLSPTDHSIPAYKKLAAAGQLPTHFAFAPLFVEINTERSQSWVQTLLEGQVPKESAAAFTLNAEAANDLALLDQFLNEFGHDETDRHGYKVRIWTKTGKNEQRDNLRYGRALADLLMQNGRHWGKLVRVAAVGPQATPGPGPSAESTRPRFTTPDGRPFLVTER